MKKELVLDTNIFIRFLIKDNQAQFIKAKKIFEDIEKKKVKGKVSILVLNEIIWVLEGFYELKRAVFIPRLLNLLALKNIKTVEIKKSVAIKILQRMEKERFDFTDFYLSAISPKENILSFDKDFTRITKR